VKNSIISTFLCDTDAHGRTIEGYSYQFVFTADDTTLQRAWNMFHGGYVNYKELNRIIMPWYNYIYTKMKVVKHKVGIIIKKIVPKK
jgi:hypothetical protein